MALCFFPLPLFRLEKNRTTHMKTRILLITLLLSLLATVALAQAPAAPQGTLSSRTGLPGTTGGSEG
jgi:hypothetical protein